MKRSALLFGLLVAGLLAGCGATPSVGASAQPAALVVAGQPAVPFGFGAEGGTAPTLLKRQSGEWLIAYVGTNVADRKIYFARSADGARWSASSPIDDAPYSDQAPCLVEAADGTVHLYFASNRDGADFGLYHARLEDAGFGPAEAVPGYEGLNDLAVAQRDGRFLLAAEVRAAGLLVSTSADGVRFGEPEMLASAGFEPAACFAPDGKALVAYQRSGSLFLRASAPGADWSAETAIKGSDRLREPALAWSGDQARLIFSERTAAGYRLRGRRIDANLAVTVDGLFPEVNQESRTPAVFGDDNEKNGLAWGMKSSSGQQGVVFARLGF